MRFPLLVSAGCLGVLVVSACTSTVTSGEATTASPTRSASVSATVSNTLPGPHPPPTENNDGTSFDPCLVYTAEELEGWGLDPATVNDVGVGDQLQRGCLWRGDGWTLQQLVVDRPLAEYLDQKAFPGSRRVAIGDKEAVTFRKPPEDKSICYVELPSEESAVGTIVSVRGWRGEKLIPDACTKAMEIATVTASKLPK